MANPIGTQFTLIGVSDYILGNGIECWVIGQTNENGVKYPYVFPKFTLEQRVAEYDLDPADIEGVLDMVLHEPHVPDPMDYRNFNTDAAAKAGLTVRANRGHAQVRVGQTVPMHLHNAPDRATARQAHQARIAEVKNRITIKWGNGKQIFAVASPNNPLKPIVDNHGIDPQRVKARAAYVQAMMGSSGPRLRINKPGGIPVADPGKPNLPYDPSVRRRGLTVALLDLPQE